MKEDSQKLLETKVGEDNRENLLSQAWNYWIQQVCNYQYQKQRWGGEPRGKAGWLNQARSTTEEKGGEGGRKLGKFID